MPLSNGPTLFLAPSPTAWQAMHFVLNDRSPASRSCASKAPVVATSAIDATNILIVPSPSHSIQQGSGAVQAQGRPGSFDGGTGGGCQRPFPHGCPGPNGAWDRVDVR